MVLKSNEKHGGCRQKQIRKQIEINKNKNADSQLHILTPVKTTEKKAE